MPLSPAGFPKDLDPSNPKGSDPGSILDAQCRNIIQSIQQTFPQMGEATTLTGTQINRAQAGWGGIRVSGPQSISAVNLTNSRIKLGPFDQAIDIAPEDVTQDVAGDTITVEAGRWLVTGIVAGRGPGAGFNTSVKIQLVETVGKVGQSLSNTAGVPTGMEFFGASFTGLYAASAQTQLELGILILTGGSLTVDFIEYMELSASRVGGAV